jgi:hypothetical protein
VGGTRSTTARSGTTPIASIKHLAAILGIPRRELEHVAALLENSPGELYRQKSIEKADGGTRDVFNPSDELRRVQKRIRERVLRCAQLPACMWGGVKGKTLRGHAELHIGSLTVVTLDIRSCFPSTRASAVAAMFANDLACNRGPAHLLTRLVTLNGAVPQGGLTSTDVVNLCLARACEEVARIASERGLTFSIWVDDLVLSGEGAENAVGDVAAILARYGYELKRKKKRVQRAGAKQLVTGLCVNSAEPTVPRARRQALEHLLLTYSARGWMSERERDSLVGKRASMTSGSLSQAKRIERLWQMLASHIEVRR